MSTQESTPPGAANGPRVGGVTAVLAVVTVISVGIAVVSQLETRRLRAELAGAPAASGASSKADKVGKVGKTEKPLKPADDINRDVDKDVDDAAAPDAPAAAGAAWDALPPSETKKITPQAVDGLLASYDHVLPARVVPALEKGQPAGVKLFSIQPGSVYQQLGLENGDIVRRVNGHDLTGPDAAREIFAKVKHAKELRLDIKRRGKPMRLDFVVDSTDAPK